MKTIRFLLAFIFSATLAFASLPAAAVWECRATATAGNLNGGGFNSARGGTDYTLQDAAQLTFTDLTCTAASTTVTSANGGFTSQMVGNCIHLTALTGTGAITGWYEIVTFTDANNVILDRTPTDGSHNITAGTFYVGGAMSLGSTLDDALCEAFVGGNVVWIKSGNYTLGQTVSVASSSATATANVKLYGYNSTRGDNPSRASSNSPFIAFGANNFSTAANWQLKNMRILESTAGALSAVVTGSDNFFENVYIVNLSPTTTRAALQAGNFMRAVNCEFVDPSGTGFIAGSQGNLVGCYIHDSDTGTSSASGTFTYAFCVFAGCKTVAYTTSLTACHNLILNCTILGSQAKVGTGVLTTGATATGLWVMNTAIYGVVNGITIGTAQQDGLTEDYNSFNNITTARTLIATGDHSVTTNPSFTDVSEITGTTATTTGSVLTQSGGDFSTVTDSVDFLRVTSGTGVTTGIYQITSHTSTTLTVSGTLGTSVAGNVVYTVGTGHNFLPTGAL